MFRIVSLCVVSIGAMTIAGCSGGGGGGGAAPQAPLPPPPPPPAVQTGVFKDSNVSGLAFVSGAQSGVTNAAGQFQCETGDDITLSVGAVTLGSAPCGPLLTPASLVASRLASDPRAISIGRFLQMLDRDGDPSNGIEISDAVQMMAENWTVPDFDAADLLAELATIISDAASVDGTVHDLPSVNAALSHLQQTIGCAYGGTFAGNMSGDASGVLYVVIGGSPFSGGFNPTLLDWLGYVPADDSQGGGGGFPAVELGAPPIIDHTGPNLAGPMAATFESPDRISGSWEFGSDGRGGTFVADRIGPSTGTHRMMGSFSGFDSIGGLTMSLTGDVITGEAFELYEAQTFQIRGTLTGDALTLTATGGGQLNGTGTVQIRDVNGDPAFINGNFEGTNFAVASCRLN